MSEPEVPPNDMAIRVTCEGAGLADLSELKPLQGELKTLSRADYEKLKTSILKHGISFPLFVWRENGDLWTIDGHQRDRVLGRMREEGYVVPQLPVDYIHAADRKEALEKILLVSSQYGRMTDESLYEFIVSAGIEVAPLKDVLALPQIDFEKFTKGYFEDEPPPPPEPQLDKAEELQKKWKVKRGQIWEIGKHRMMCGDCTDVKAIDELMDGIKVGVIISDPPYNVAAPGSPIVNDDISQKQSLKLHTDFCRVAPMDKNSSAVIFHSPRQFTLALDAFRDVGWKFDRALWMHEQGGRAFPWHGWYMTGDIVLCFSRGKGAWVSRVDDGVTDTYTHQIGKGSNEQGIKPGDKTAFLYHPTLKPLWIVEEIIGHTAGNIYDGFLGAGTTMVAAERLGRICFGTEIDTKYCAVILERMSDMGLTPKLLATPKPVRRKAS
jgi:hypothetical protein